MSFGVQFGAVQRVLRLLLEVHPQRHDTLLSRLRNMQRERFPDGVGVGRGVRLSYSLEQLSAVVFLHMLVDALIPPDPAMSMFREGRRQIMDVVCNTLADFPPGGPVPESGPNTLFLALEGAGLSLLRTARTSAGNEKPQPLHRTRNQVRAVSRAELALRLDERTEAPIQIFDFGQIMWKALTFLIHQGDTTPQDIAEAVAAWKVR